MSTSLDSLAATTARLREQLVRELGAACVLDDAATLAHFSHDLFWSGAQPLLVLTPDYAEQVAAAVRIAVEAGVAVLPRGGGMSYTAGYLSDFPASVMLDLRGLNSILEVDCDRRMIVAEAGASWAQLADALSGTGMRTPYWGPLSGLRASLGGTLSQNSVFFGSGQHGSAAESVLGLDVVTARGDILRTGLGGGALGLPFTRWGGPDLAGLFIGDNGALGVKVRAALRLIDVPAALGAASFAFPALAPMIATQIALVRRGLGSEVFGIDAYKARNSAQTGRKLADATQTAVALVRSSESLFQGLREITRYARKGTDALEQAPYSLHLTVEAKDADALARELASIENIARAEGGEALEPLVPRAMRARPFPPLRSALGGQGQRWVPVHGMFSLAAAQEGIAAIESVVEKRRGEMEARSVAYSPLTVNVSNGILFEPCFYWQDAISSLHREAYGDGLNPAWETRAAVPETRRLVAEIWREVAHEFDRFGATHFQLGRRYPYLGRLEPATRALLGAIKRELDPQGLINPGALGLGGAA